MNNESTEQVAEPKPDFVPHPLQALYRGAHVNGTYVSMYDKYKSLLRALFIRPADDPDKQVYVCSDDERRRLASACAYEARHHTAGGSDFAVGFRVMLRDMGPTLDFFVDYFMLRPLLLTRRCFVAGGAILRLVMNSLTRKEQDNDAFRKTLVAEYETSDIDVFFTDVADINTYLSFLASKNVRAEKLPDKHDLYRISCDTEVFWSTPFLLQFTKINTTDLYALLEDFDLPMCQIGLDHTARLHYSIGFELVFEHGPDAVTHVRSHESDTDVKHRSSLNPKLDITRKDYSARVAKFEKLGFRFAHVNERTYYGRRPWTVDYYRLQDVHFTARADNVPLLLTLTELHNARLNAAQKLYNTKLATDALQQYEAEKNPPLRFSLAYNDISSKVLPLAPATLLNPTDSLTYVRNMLYNACFPDEVDNAWNKARSRQLCLRRALGDELD